jgi:acyl dehydratase
MWAAFEEVNDLGVRVKHWVLFYISSLSGLFRKQRLRVPLTKLKKTESFRYSKLKRYRWFKAFKVKDKNSFVPFTYYSPEIVRLIFFMMTKLHLNYKNLLHLRHEQEFIAPEKLKFCKYYKVKTELADIIKLRSSTIALTLKTQITTKKDEVLLSAKDLIFVKEVKTAGLSKLEESSVYGNHQDRSLIKLALKRAEIPLEQKPTAEIRVPKGMGVRYGHVSGDMNFIHTNKAFAKVFGFKDVFIQGMCTVNYLLKSFFADQGLQLKSLIVTFTNPVYEDQIIYLRQTESLFEITNDEGKLLAYGDFSAA